MDRTVEKPVFLIDVYNNDVTEMKRVRDKILKQRIIAIDKFKDAKKVGVIMEVKPGQKFGLGTDDQKATHRQSWGNCLPGHPHGEAARD